MDAVCVFATQQIVTYADPPGLCCAWVYATTIYTTARTDAAHNNHASTATQAPQAPQTSSGQIHAEQIQAPQAHQTSSEQIQAPQAPQAPRCQASKFTRSKFKPPKHPKPPRRQESKGSILTVHPAKNKLTNRRQCDCMPGGIKYDAMRCVENVSGRRSEFQLARAAWVRPEVSRARGG